MKTQIEKRLQELKSDREKVQAQLNAIYGAIGELEKLLVEPEKKKDE